MLTQVGNLKSSTVKINDFKGYNHNKTLAETEFYDMKNLSSSLYPVLSQRKARGTVSTLTAPHGLFAKNKLCYVDGTSFYYDGVVKGSVTATDKKFVSMGAYILIFPDKKYYNTSTGVFGSLENTVSASCTFTTTVISGTGIGAGFKAYDGVKITGSSITANNMTAVVLSVTDNSLTFNTDIFTANTTAETITVSRLVPDMDYLTEHENRVWGCSSTNHEIYASKLGDPFNFNSYEGISTDSYTATIGSDGDFTGVAPLGGYVTFFKEHHIHRMHGSKPSNYQLFDTDALGCAKGSDMSIGAVNGVMFYNSVNGIVRYEGSIPEGISSVFGDVKYSDASAGVYKYKYYVSMKDTSNVWHLFVYDTLTGLWSREDNTNAAYFTELDGMLYYIDLTDNKIKKIEGSDTESLEWYAEFGDFDGYIMERKRVNKITFRLQMYASSSVSVYIKYDDGSYSLVKTISTTLADTKKQVLLSVIPQRCDHFRIKLTGTGYTDIYAMEKTITVGSDK